MARCYSMGASNVMTVDLEDWFHSLEPDPGHWSRFQRRAETATLPLLDLLNERQAKATFFVLGDVAIHAPDLIRRLVADGHEVGTHGMWHQLVYHQSPKAFRKDLRESIARIEDLSATKVVSYRAPYFSITEASLWALDILVEEGIRHDSSIFPVRNPRYGISNAKRTPHRIRPGLWEWPLTTLPTPFGNVPVAGGVYLRLLPWRVFDTAIRLLEAFRQPVILYIHPWELDPDQPRHRTSSRFLNFRHYHGLNRSSWKLSQLLRRIPYRTLAQACLHLADGAVA